LLSFNKFVNLAQTKFNKIVKNGGKTMFKQNFIRLCNKKGVAPTVVCQQVGLSNATFSCWTDSSVPRQSTLLKISEYFGVSVEELLSDPKEKSPDESELDEVEAYLAEIGIEIRSMDDSDRQELKNYVQYLVSRKKQV
jgi:transcriptional regulator with XRE-family HTH domain